MTRAAGGLVPAIALALSAHLDLCPHCARRAEMLDAVGGNILENTPTAEIPSGALDEIMARLDEPSPDGTAPAETIAGRLANVGLECIPHSLKALTAAAAEIRGWKKRPGGVREFFLRRDSDGAEMRYLLIPPGTGVPRHGHGGMEVTLVVSGCFRDETGEYGPGDLEVASGALTHRPVAGDGEPCLAFAVTRAPLRFTGVLGLLQRALGRA